MNVGESFVTPYTESQIGKAENLKESKHHFLIHTTMSTKNEQNQELNEKELRETNGGGLLGGDDSSSEGGLAGAVGIGNLLSTSSSSQDGDESSSSSTSIGNGINADLGAISKKLTS